MTATTGAATIGTGSGARFASTSATGFTANGLVIAGNAVSPADALAGPATVDIVAGSGAITAQAITATDSGHDLHLARREGRLEHLTVRRLRDRTFDACLAQHACVELGEDLALGEVEGADGDRPVEGDGLGRLC